MSHQSVIDIDQEQVAAVYAKAMFAAAENAGTTDETVEQLDSLVDDVLDRHKTFAELLESSLVSNEEKEQMLDRVFGSRVSELVLSFLKVLSSHGRLNCLRAVRHRFRDLYNESRGMVEVTLSTPGAVDDTFRAEISGQLEKTLGAKPILSVVSDASLLGGVVVRVGDTVYDGSVATRLQQMRGQMIDRTVEQIESRRESFIAE